VKLYPGVYLAHTYGISFGKHCSVNSGAQLDGRGGISIGDYVMIGPHAVIVSSQHRFDDCSVPMAQRDHELQPTTIGDDVWIGAHAVIVGGITIGRGAVVAAGSIVTKDVGEYDIVAGVPARVVRNRKAGSMNRDAGKPCN
jgi:acetyltransferase-like isoleucine patch superfamily enzyme